MQKKGYSSKQNDKGRFINELIIIILRQLRPMHSHFYTEVKQITQGSVRT